MKNSNIILLPYITTFTKSILPVLRAGDAAVICGDAGTGVSVCCRYICSNWGEAEYGKIIEIHAFSEDAHLKLAQHLALQVLRSEMPANWCSNCITTLMEMVGDKLRKNEVGLLVIDRAELAPVAFIDSVLAMAAERSKTKRPIGVLLCMRQFQRNLPLFPSDASTSIAFTAQIPPLAPNYVVAVMGELTQQAAELLEKFSQKEESALLAVSKLSMLSAGNLRRMDQFAKYLDREAIPLPTNATAIEKRWKQAFGGDGMGMLA